jgi:hypothetical protein
MVATAELNHAGPRVIGGQLWKSDRPGGLATRVWTRVRCRAERLAARIHVPALRPIPRYARTLLPPSHSCVPTSEDSGTASQPVTIRNVAVDTHRAGPTCIPLPL